MMADDLSTWLNKTDARTSKISRREPFQLTTGEWIDIRLFISSTFKDTRAERDIIVKRIVPKINRKYDSWYLRIVPIDLRWGVLPSVNTCQDNQRACLNLIDTCRHSNGLPPWLLGLRTARIGTPS